MNACIILSDEEPQFPDPESLAFRGRICLGGNLKPETLKAAYEKGIFPWYLPGHQIEWWYPPERMVLYPKDIKIGRSMRPVLRNNGFRLRFDTDFRAVINNCRRVKRKGQNGTWIGDDMVEAYTILHHRGRAHSLEVWKDNCLVGGLYGVSTGNVFSGESMFSLEANASKIALIALAKLGRELGYEVIDCQLYTPHLESMGAHLIESEEFTRHLKSPLKLKARLHWGDIPEMEAAELLLI